MSKEKARGNTISGAPTPIVSPEGDYQGGYIMAGQAIVVSITWVSGTTLVLTVGALGAAAKTLRVWFSSLWAPKAPQEPELPSYIPSHYQENTPYRATNSSHLLASALNIETQELEAAQRRANDELLSYMVGEGMVPRHDAQSQRELERRRLAPYDILEGRSFCKGDEVLFLAALAEQLGITLNNLQSAREAALETNLTLAVEEGILTEAQVEDRLARYRVQCYTDPAALLAEALDISLEDLDRYPVAIWIAKRRLTWRALNARLVAARRDALEQAADDGVITPEQVNCLLSEHRWGEKPRYDIENSDGPKEQETYGFLYLRNTDHTIN